MIPTHNNGTDFVSRHLGSERSEMAKQYSLKWNVLFLIYYILPALSIYLGSGCYVGVSKFVNPETPTFGQDVEL
jgi:hypothetical protein